MMSSLPSPAGPAIRLDHRSEDPKAPRSIRTGQKSSGGSSERLQTADGPGEAVCRWFSRTSFWPGVQGDEVTYGFSMVFFRKVGTNLGWQS